MEGNDLGDTNANDLEDIESDDGDVEEADHINSSGEAELVSRSSVCLVLGGTQFCYSCHF